MAEQNDDEAQRLIDRLLRIADEVVGKQNSEGGTAPSPDPAPATD